MTIALINIYILLIIVDVQSVTCNIHQLQPPCVTLQKYHLSIPGMLHWGILMMPTQTPDRRDVLAIYTSAHSYMARATLAMIGSMVGGRQRTWWLLLLRLSPRFLGRFVERFYASVSAHDW